MDIFSKIIEADLVDPLRFGFGFLRRPTSSIHGVVIHPTQLPIRRVDQGAQRRIHQNHRDRTI